MSDFLLKMSLKIASYEDSPSQAGRPAGSAKGGLSFEKTVAEGICGVLKYLLYTNAGSLRICRVVPRKAGPFPDNSKPVADGALGIENPSLERCLVPSYPCLDQIFSSESPTPPEEMLVPEEWLKREFNVSEWSEKRLEEMRSRGWIPAYNQKIRFSGEGYREIYRGLTTRFDGFILFIDKKTLVNKTLLEIKSAKSSDKEKIDGNAHERFSYQNMDYLEIASLYPRTELLLLTNDAFLRYRNKYHTGFSVHAIRLESAFCWYRFNIVSSSDQYFRLFSSWEKWLLGR